MAYQEYVQKAIATGKSYDDLPAKVRGAIPLQEWKGRWVAVGKLCDQMCLLGFTAGTASVHEHFQIHCKCMFPKDAVAL